MESTRGRPRRASRQLLQEAAFELFQVGGYRSTSVEQIARTAGFSRATFFNFFASKSELFWVETDTLIERLRDFLRSQAGGAQQVPLQHALLRFVDTLTSSEIPWALQHYRLLDAPDDLVASGAGRVQGLTRVFEEYLSQMEHESRQGQKQEQLADGAPQGSALARKAHAASVSATLLVALLAWVDAGVERGELRTYLEEAFAQSVTVSSTPLTPARPS